MKTIEYRVEYTHNNQTLAEIVKVRALNINSGMIKAVKSAGARGVKREIHSVSFWQVI